MTKKSYRVASIAAGGAIVLASVLAGGPANAYQCQVSKVKTATQTTVQNVTCNTVQAGIWRYVGSSPVHYVGSWSASVSSVFNANGVNAGNDYRGQQGINTYAWERF